MRITAAVAAMIGLCWLTGIGGNAIAADLHYKIGPMVGTRGNCRHVWKCGPGLCGWQEVCRQRCHGYLCYSLYGAYGPYGGRFLLGGIYRAARGDFDNELAKNS